MAVLGAPGTECVLAQEDLSFEGVQDGEVAFWQLRGRYQHDAVIDSNLAYSGSNSLRMSFKGRDPDHPSSFGVGAQSIPPEEFVGRHVRLSGHIRTERVSDGYAGLWVRIDGLDGPLSLENMQDTPVIGTHEWQRFEIQAPVTEDARRIVFGTVLTGEGTAWFDDLELTGIDPSRLPPPSDEVAAYLESALDIMEQNSIKRDSVDWRSLRATTVRMAAGAETPADAYFALRAALRRLGDGHSYFFTPEQVHALNNTGESSDALGPWISPTGARLGEDIGYVSIPGFSGTNAARTTRFADEIQGVIADVDSDDLCGWVVDLRDDTGGNVFPMIAGLGPILGEGDFGGGVRADGTAAVYRWYRNGGAGVGEGTPVSVSGEPYVLIPSNPPVAVLLGPRTASSGEATVLAFIGRPSTRTFGQPTAGQTTGNAPFYLSDGAVLNLAVTIMTDRLDRRYGGPVLPDVAVEESPPNAALLEQPVISEATRWLREQEGCRESQ